MIISKEIITGLTRENVIKISKYRNEPEFLLNYRLAAFDYWETLKEPQWSFPYYINYDNLTPFSNPIYNKDNQKQINNVFKSLNLDNNEEKRVKLAIDLVLDSSSVITLDQNLYQDYGIIFCSIKDAAINYPNLIKEYLGSVVPYTDNFFAALNAAFFSDGTFVYIPSNTKCPIDISSYFKLDSLFAAQLERTLIIVEENGFVNYLEGCSAPVSKANQLHSAVVEIYLKNNAIANYHTLQNWYSGDKNGIGGVYNFVVKRGLCLENAELNWTQLELGSFFTWKYPSCILKGNNSKATFYSLSYTNNCMQTDTGTKMIHLGKNTKSYILSKSLVNDFSKNLFRFLVKAIPNADNSSCFSDCSTLILSNNCLMKTMPVFKINNPSFKSNHEAWIFSLDQLQLFYLQNKGFTDLEIKKILSEIFVVDILNRLPEEFYSEVFALLDLKIEGNG